MVCINDYDYTHKPNPTDGLLTLFSICIFSTYAPPHFSAIILTHSLHIVTFLFLVTRSRSLLLPLSRLWPTSFLLYPHSPVSCPLAQWPGKPQKTWSGYSQLRERALVIAEKTVTTRARTHAYSANQLCCLYWVFSVRLFIKFSIIASNSIWFWLSSAIISW